MGNSTGTGAKNRASVFGIRKGKGKVEAISSLKPYTGNFCRGREKAIFIKKKAHRSPKKA
jgi:hypothetical protein